MELLYIAAGTIFAMMFVITAANILGNGAIVYALITSLVLVTIVFVKIINNQLNEEVTKWKL